jgi:hypothetical protein
VKEIISNNHQDQNQNGPKNPAFTRLCRGRIQLVIGANALIIFSVFKFRHLRLRVGYVREDAPSQNRRMA